ncbi:MAG: amidohydrolase family protein [Pseudomonadales bacterium]
MKRMPALPLRSILMLLVTLGGWLAAPEASATDATSASSDTPDKIRGLELKPTRHVAFDTSTGTWMSLDVSPDGRQIVFELVGDLYTLPVDGGDATALTSGMAFDSQPRFSPDGNRVVFVSDRSGAENLWTIGLDGSEPRMLTDETGDAQFASPTYAPDGSHVVASRTSWSLGVFELWAYHVDGGKGVQITKAKTNGDTDRARRVNSLGAVYSPDGRYLYFARKLGGFGYNVSLPLWQIVRRDLRNEEEDVLTQAQGSAFRPLLSPDGGTLIYGTRYEQQTGLRRHDLKTGADEWLVFPVTRDEQESVYSRDLLPGYAFTPDGRSVIYTAAGGIRQVALESGEVSEIPFHARIDQGLGPRLYFPYRLGLGPVRSRLLMGSALSPDGRQLAFGSFLELYVYDLTSGDLHTVGPTGEARGDTGLFHPAWSPDGREVAYVSWSSAGGHVWRARADGRGQPRRVSRRPGFYSDPAWSPDGKRILALRAGSYDRLYREWDQGTPIGSDLVWFPRQGGDAELVVPAAGYHQPHFGEEPDRIYYYTGDAGLESLRYDGTDRRQHLVVKGKGIYMAEEEVPADDVRLSPDGRHALVLHANQLYLVSLLNPNLSGLTLSITDPNMPLARLTDVGADAFGWAEAGRTIFWSVGNALYVRPLASVRFDQEAETGVDTAGGDASTVETDSGVGAGPSSARESDHAPAEADPAVRTYTVDVYRPRYEPEGTLVLQGGTVLTMEEGVEPVTDGTVVITNGRIAAVGPAADVPIPEGARVVDVTGKYLLPGFIDTHAHFRPLRRVLDDQNWAFLANLAYGVTTGIDVQPSTTDILAYEDLIDAGMMIGPRALSTGPGIFSNNAFKSVEHAEAVLRRYKSHYGVRNLKSYLVGNRRQRQYVVQAAEKLKLMPTTEGGLDMKLDMTHVIDGFSGNEHNFPLVALYDDTVQLVARSGIAYTPTLLVTYGGPFAESYFYTRESPHRDPKLRRFMPENVIAARTLRGPWFLEEEYTFPQVAAQAGKIVRAGGRVGVGAHGQLQGLGYHWEMRALASGGLTPMEVLTAATRHGAEMIGIAEDLGTVTAGKLADLVVMDADPTFDIRNTTTLRYVVKNGELFDASTLDELWPEEKPLPRQWWWDVAPTVEPGDD